MLASITYLDTRGQQLPYIIYNTLITTAEAAGVALVFIGAYCVGMKILDRALNLIAPNNCLGCEREGSIVCDWCLPDIFDAVPSRCAFCQAQTRDFQVCAFCKPKTPLRQIWVSTIYKDSAKQLVRHMKFNPDRSACVVIASWLDQTSPYFEDVTITFVPTARSRVRTRGFDHAELIAKEFAQIRNLPCKALLTRAGNTRQVTSERKKRIQQVQGAYLPVSNHMPKRVILIDDIMTTGATLNEAARTLKQAGAKKVDACAFAQTI